MFSVIFDMDGTLLDTQRISLEAWDYTGELFGLGKMSVHVPNLCGVSKAYGDNYLRERYPDIDVLEFRRIAFEYESKNLVVKYKPGVVEMLEFLKENNIKMAVASGSTPEFIEERLGAIEGAKDWFSELVSSEEVPNGKPEPDVFLEAARRIGADPKDCFVFEDSPNGIIAAHKAGMKCIGIPDIAQFNDEIKKLLFKELDTMDKAIDVLKEYL